MKQKHDIDLRGLIPETPEMCRDAVLKAVNTYREEKKMKRSYKAILLAAVIAVLLCGTALAIVRYYSVRDYIADGKPSEAFDDAVVSLEESVSSNGLTFTLGDAVFDGRDLAFTMNMSADEEATSMYVYPKLEGFCGDRKLNVYYNGFGMTYDFGFFLPSTDPEYSTAENQGVSATLFNDTAIGEVTWRYTLALYRPTGELVSPRSWDDAAESYSEYEEYLRSLHGEGKIGCWRGTEMSLDWLDAVVEGDIEAEGRTFADRIEATGLFELADVITFEFTTAVPESEALSAPAAFDFDGYTVTVKSINQTFMQVDYVLEVVYDEVQEHEHFLEQFYALSDQHGNALARRESMISLEDDRKTAIVTGSATRISDEPLTAITFTLDHTLTIDQNDTAEDMPFFTVNIPQ